MSLPRPVRRVQPARRITCNALSALFCLIPAGGGVWHPHPFSPETRQKKAHPYTTINRRVILPAMSLHRPVRRVEPAPRITSDAVSAQLCLIRAGGGLPHPLPSSREITRKKAHPYTTINRRVILPAMSLYRPVQRVEPAPRITSDAVSARFCLTRAGGVYMASASILARNKAKKSPPVHDNQSLNTAIASYLPLSRLHSTLRKLTQYHSI
jgi:hypothetical protein